MNLLIKANNVTQGEGAPDRVGPDVDEQPVGTDIEIIARRELAIRAVDAIAEVLEVDVSVHNLLILAANDQPTPVRLAAKRALRCVEAIGRQGSPLIKAIGEVGIYDYVEGVVEFGASETTYLDLVSAFRLTAAEATGLYALRRLVAEHSDGHEEGFPTLIRALASVGISPSQAGRDPEEAVAVLDEAGFFIDHAGGVTFDRPIFWPRGAGRVPLRHDQDTPRSYAASEGIVWLRDHFLGMEPRNELGDEE